MGAINAAARTVGLFLALAALSSCTTTELGEGVKSDKTPAPNAAKSEMDIAPLNETDTVTALLQPVAKLKPDTLEAAQHDTKVSKIPYIGAWAADDEGCGKIDEDAYESFAVITPKSIRQFQDNCAIKATPPDDNPTSVQAACKADAAADTRNITLFITAIGSLQIINKPGATPVEYIRCQLPK